ncbi:MAG: RluA family pseudouridine synthase [Cystobacterineae bacterium]|nr:RluA family pseudouridine synthase [Cystobacterineae bacterium]
MDTEASRFKGGEEGEKALTQEAGEGGEEGADADTCLLSFVVESNYAGWRLDRYLCQKLRRLSRQRVQALIRQQLGPSLKPSSPVKPGMRLEFRRTLPKEPSVPGPEALQSVFEDEDLLVLNKPAGLPVHPTARYFHHTLVGQLAKRYPSPPHPAHRLDRETSGLLLCTKNLEAGRHMARAFAASEVYKEYLAIAEGHPPQNHFSIEAPIAEGSPSIRIAVRVVGKGGGPEGGKAATTRVEVLQRFEREGDPFCLLKCIPLTGRQHQIRVHLQHQGYPLVGDKIYGPDEMYFDRFSKHCLEPEAWLRLRLPRHALHASLLRFIHPRSLESLCFELPLAEDLRGFLGAL